MLQQSMYQQNMAQQQQYDQIYQAAGGAMTGAGIGLGSLALLAGGCSVM
jgi:hypothetical protein